jgi:hypothetical protein
VFKHDWKPGDWVVYRLSKHGRSPGQRAQQVSATRKGESYNYVVDKFWVVEEVKPEGQLVVRTPGGKCRTVDSADPNLHRARWWHRFQWGSRFRTAEKQLHENPLHHGGGAEPA